MVSLFFCWDLRDGEWLPVHACFFSHSLVWGRTLPCTLLLTLKVRLRFPSHQSSEQVFCMQSTALDKSGVFATWSGSLRLPSYVSESLNLFTPHNAFQNSHHLSHVAVTVKLNDIESPAPQPHWPCFRHSAALDPADLSPSLEVLLDTNVSLAAIPT